jgi:signal transduction histidine kinase/DNA-binding response OmpR family regulator/ligand-binding sensor domain-containing protein
MSLINVVPRSFLVFLLLISSFYVQAQTYDQVGLPITQIFELKEHGGSDQNWWLSETKNGLIYAGSGSGLIEWDGEQWHQYNTPNNTRIRSFSEFHDGQLYVGTLDDLGVYRPSENGRITYFSLLDGWSAEHRQIGEVWSTAANKHGVAFVTDAATYYWDGKTVSKMQGVPGGKHRVFAFDNGFIFKATDDETLYKIIVEHTPVEPTFTLKNTGLTVPPNSYPRSIIYNRTGKLTVITANDGIFEQQGDKLVLKVSAAEFGDKVQVYNGIQASDGYYYLVSLFDGLFILDESFQLVRQYTEKDNLGTNTFLAVLEDQQGHIWLSGVPNIIKMVPPHHYSTFEIGDSAVIIDKLALVNDQVMAVGDGLFGLEPGELPNSSPTFSSLTDNNDIRFDALEYQGHILYAGHMGVFAQPIGSEKAPFRHVLSTAWARSLQIDPLTNTLFVSTYDGLFHVELKNGEWISKVVTGSKDNLEFVAIEDTGIVWAGTATQELYRVENAQFADKPTKVEKFVAQDGLPPGNIMPFKVSSNVVFATTDGLMEYAQGRQPEIQPAADFPPLFTLDKQEVFRLYEDFTGRVWYRINQDTGFSQKQKSGQWITQDNLFRPFSGSGIKDFLVTSENILWFAQSGGRVYRANIQLTAKPPVKSTLNIGQIINLDNSAILYGGRLAEPSLPVLDQSNNSIRIYYALSANSVLKPTDYRHRIIGRGKENWSAWSAEDHKDYTLLGGGDFQFQLEAKDQWGRIYAIELDFAVLPIWYLSNIAWILYAIVLIVLLTMSGWLSQRWRTQKLTAANLRLEHTVAERTREISEKVEELEQQQILKERFFNNISHELRTPLTLTIAPLQDVLRDHPDLQQCYAFPIKTALRNATEMLDLVGNILDISRLDAGQFPLRIAQYDIAELLTLIVPRFNAWTKHQQQRLNIENAQDPVMLFFDRDQLDKCISNLLSNAIKYSGIKSHIDIRLIKEKDQVGIEIKDNGPGLSAELQDKIFERYYQGQASESITAPGTGIGLSIVQELMKLHQGRVELSSEIGQGCCFTLWLQSGKEHFLASQLREPVTLPTQSNEGQDAAFPAPSLASIGNSTESRFDEDTTTLLVVDDNIELRQFISLRLSGYYRVIQASNGKEGLAKAITMLPDLIISDVMMPEMNGLEMLTELKKNALTALIPLVLLSAKSGKRDTVEGLQTGADDYMSKPFDTSELITRISGLINSRKMIRSKIEAELSLPTTVQPARSSFTEKLRYEIVQNLTKPEFSIDVLAQALAMSRRTLARKCQDECQQTVGQFITEVRMQTALKLLKEQQLSISEIAYGTGFESLSYFSRTFKKLYGKSPSALV